MADRVRDIFIVCDFDNDCNNEHYLQMAGKARLLAEQRGCEVCAVCANEYDEDKLTGLVRHGVNNILVCMTENDCQINNYCDILSDLFLEINPEVVLFPASATGRNIAATLSFRLSAGLTADCIEITVDGDGEVVFFRAAINNTVIAKIKCINCEIKMCTVKKDVFKRQVFSDEAGVRGRIRYIDYKAKYKENGGRVKVLEAVHYENKDTVDISKSPIVFCIGRGVSSMDTLLRIYKIAQKCGAEIVGTRSAVEEKVIGKERQVGQSGKIIAPDLYVGFGVSGASQHMVGINNAGTIIAINNDKNAAIFQYADYAIVEDVDSFVAALEGLIFQMDVEDILVM